MSIVSDEKFIKKSDGIVKDVKKGKDSPVSQISLAVLASIEPISAVVTTVFNSAVNKMYANRETVFYKELGSGKIELTPELVDSEPWLHKFICARRAALNAQQEGKIKRFAMLLNTFSQEGKLDEIDEFDESLKILEALSDREWGLLLILSNYQKEPLLRKNQQQEHNKIGVYWNSFMEEAKKTLNLSGNEVLDICTRLTGSGVLIEFQSSRLGGLVIGYSACTHTFFKLKSYVEQSSTDG